MFTQSRHNYLITIFMLLREIQNIIFKTITRNTSIIQIKKKKTIIALDKNIFLKGNLTRKHKSNLLFFFKSRYVMLHKGFELTTLYNVEG